MSENNVSPLASPRIFSAAYWRQAAALFRSTHMLVFAACIIALRVAVKAARIPLAANLSLTFDCYVNSLGSIVYGPVMALVVGAVSDTLGCLLFPSANGPYFPPFILVEMSSSFLFALFFWKRKLTIPRILTAKFTVNMVCNVCLTSLFVKWSYYVFYGIEKAQAYAIINLSRIVKNLVLFPLESIAIALVLSAALPALRTLRLLPPQEQLRPTWKHYVLIAALTLLSVGLVLFYIFFLKEFISQHNIKFL